MNNDLFFQIFEGAAAFFEAFMVYLYLSGLFEKRTTKLPPLLYYVLFAAGLAALSIMLRSSMWLTVYLFVGVFLLAWVNYQTRHSSRIIAVVFFSAMMMASEILTTGLVVTVWHLPLPDMFEFSAERAFCILVTKLIQILLIKLMVSVVQWKKQTTEAEPVRIMVPLFFCQISSILVAHYIFTISVDVINHFSPASLGAMLGIMYINVIIFWYFDRIKAIYAYKSKSEAAEYKLELQRQHVQLLAEHQQETDALWHDMKKHLRLMKTLVENGESALSAEYVRSMAREMDSAVKIIRTGEPILDALLTEQHRRATKAHVPYTIDVRIEGTLQIASMDLCTIMDNAKGKLPLIARNAFIKRFRAF